MQKREEDDRVRWIQEDIGRQQEKGDREEAERIARSQEEAERIARDLEEAERIGERIMRILTERRRQARKILER